MKFKLKKNSSNGQISLDFPKKKLSPDFSKLKEIDISIKKKWLRKKN